MRVVTKCCFLPNSCAPPLVSPQKYSRAYSGRARGRSTAAGHCGYRHTPGGAETCPAAAPRRARRGTGRGPCHADAAGHSDVRLPPCVGSLRRRHRLLVGAPPKRLGLHEVELDLVVARRLLGLGLLELGGLGHKLLDPEAQGAAWARSTQTGAGWRKEWQSQCHSRERGLA